MTETEKQLRQEVFEMLCRFKRQYPMAMGIGDDLADILNKIEKVWGLDRFKDDGGPAREKRHKQLFTESKRFLEIQEANRSQTP